MLTGKLVRVRYAKNHLAPYYLDVTDPVWQETAERLVEIYRARVNCTRGELEDDIRDTFDDAQSPQIHQGLAKLLEDRCKFAVVSDDPPEDLREAVFQAAVEQRNRRTPPLPPTQPEPENGDGLLFSSLPILRPSFDRLAVLQQVAAEFEIPAEDLERGLFADLRSEQQMISFKDITPQRLLQRYNVALAQALLFRATAVKVVIRGEPPQRYRQLLRLVKFHRLLCEVQALGENSFCLRLDGPLSLFSATQKYGLQLAVFLPAVLLCKDFDIEADLLWGPKKTPKKFRLSHKDGLVSHYTDRGTYVPVEMAMFVDLFQKRVPEWEISQEPEMLPLGDSLWIPDYQLIHKDSGQVIYMEVLGFWRRSSVAKHLDRLRQHAPAPFVLAVSDQLHVEESDLEGLPAGVMRFRQMPLPKEVARLAEELLNTASRERERPEKAQKNIRKRVHPRGARDSETQLPEGSAPKEVTTN